MNFPSFPYRRVCWQVCLCALLMIGILGESKLFSQVNPQSPWERSVEIKETLKLDTLLSVWKEPGASRQASNAFGQLYHPLPEDSLILSPDTGYWFHLSIHNSRPQDTLWLYMGTFDEVWLYRWGDSLPIAKAGLLTNQGDIYDPPHRLHLPLPMPEGRQEYVIRVNNYFRKYGNTLDPKVDTKAYRDQQWQERRVDTINYFIFNGLFLGCSLVFLIFSIFQYVFYRDQAYLYYSTYLVGMIVYCLRIFEGNNEFAFIFSHIQEAYYYLEIPNAFINFIAYVLFIKNFLYLDRIPVISKIFRYSIWFLFAYAVFDVLVSLVWGIETSYILYFYVRLVLIFWALAVMYRVYLLRAKLLGTLVGFIVAGSSLVLIMSLISILLFWKITGDLSSYNDILATIDRRLWNIPFFYLQVGILVEVILFSLGLSFRNMLIHQEAKEKEQEKMSLQQQQLTIQKNLKDAEMKALRAQLKPHIIFNFLNSVLNMIQKGEKEEAERGLSSFGKYLRKILINSESPQITLAEELELSRDYLNIEQSRYADFQFNILTDASVDYDTVQVPPMALQPYLENAIHHGLRRKNGLKQLTLEIQKKGEFLSCTIDDTGIGREAANRRRKIHQKGTGLGIKLNKERLSHVNIEVIIMDKYDENNQASGTRVELRIPLSD